jgi:hypothetical protein
MFMQAGLPVYRIAMAAGLAVVIALSLYCAPAQAQGSTGGSIGKQDKAVSGDRGGGGASKPAARERPARSERSSSKRSSGGGGGGGNFDGTWASASQGRTTCSDRTTDVVTISGGQMSGTGFSGRVTGSGSVSGVWAGSGISATVSGRLSGRSGSGSFRRSDGCAGTWTLSKQ